MRRRAFVKSSGLAMFGIGTAPSWLARAAFGATTTASKKVLVVVFQRGAMDGLNAVVPFAERQYYAMRPSIAIPAPSRTAEAGDCAIDLDGRFGLHPSLKALKPIWDAKRLAIVEAVGSNDPTRSHFDAQDYMESGTPGVKSTRDGWLNRALAAGSKDKVSPVRAVSMGPNLPRAMRGANAAVALNSVKDFQVKDAMASEAFEKMYLRSGDAELSGKGRETFEAMKLLESIRREPYAPAAQYPGGRLGQSLKEIARLIKAGVGLEVAFADMGGWDTHVQETGLKPTTGTLSNLLREFGDALGAFHQDLGDRMEDVVVVTMSEFGRTARENGNRGTDHGHANVMFAFGGPVKGGKIYGEWPGLAPEQLYERRDLAVTTDFRAVLADTVSRHLGNRNTAAVFPGFVGEGAGFSLLA